METTRRGAVARLSALKPLCLAAFAVMTTIVLLSRSRRRSLASPEVLGGDSRGIIHAAATGRTRRSDHWAEAYFRRKSPSSSMRRHWHVMGRLHTDPPDMVLLIVAGTDRSQPKSLFRTAAAVDHETIQDSRLSRSFPILCNVAPHPDSHCAAQRVKGHLPSVQRYGAAPPQGVAFHPEVLRHASPSHPRHAKLDYAFCLQVALSYRPRFLLVLPEDALDQKSRVLHSGDQDRGDDVADSHSPCDVSLDDNQDVSAASTWRRDATLAVRKKRSPGLAMAGRLRFSGFRNRDSAESLQREPEISSGADNNEISEPLRVAIEKIFNTPGLLGPRDRVLDSAALFPKTALEGTWGQTMTSGTTPASTWLLVWLFLALCHATWCWWSRTPLNGSFLLLTAGFLLVICLLQGTLEIRWSSGRLVDPRLDAAGPERGMDVEPVFYTATAAEKLASELAESSDNSQSLIEAIRHFAQELEK